MYIWSKLELRSFFLKALRLTYADANEKIRLAALKIVDHFIDSSALRLVWGKLKNLALSEIEGEAADNFGPFDVIESLKSTASNWKVTEVVFLVLSFVGSNDTHRQVRLEAMRLVGKLAGTIKNEILLQQSIKKDQMRQFSKVPLLCCGLFAHGIEDQFVRIRLAALISLHAHLADLDATEYFSVFMDALLDESELVRLAALKLLSNFPEIKLTTSNGLESLLALLDDQNSEIRSTALFIIESKLSLCSSAAAVVLESLLRTQRCLEAAVRKFPEIESKALKAAAMLIARSRPFIGNDFLVHLHQTAIPKFMKPANFLPNQMASSNSNLSNIHLVMQAAFEDDYNKSGRNYNKPNYNFDAQFVKLFSRSNGFNMDDNVNFIFNHRFNYVPKLHPLPDKSKFNLLVGNSGCLASKFEASSPLERKKYFHGNPPLAYFRFDSVERSGRQIVIKNYKLMGDLDDVHLTLKSSTGDERFIIKYGSILVAKGDEKGPIIIISSSNQVIVYRSE